MRRAVCSLHFTGTSPQQDTLDPNSPKTNMDFSFATFATLFLLFAAAFCAPARHARSDACAEAQMRSVELNRIAKNASLEARQGNNYNSDFNTQLVWMEKEDKCDPEDLRHNSAKCLGKVLDVLGRYSSLVGRLDGFPKCSESVKRVLPVIQDLQRAMTDCVGSRAAMNPDNASDTQKEATMTLESWEKDQLCRFTMDRLFSFSIVTARVFAAGDPAHHGKDSTLKCK